MPVESPPHWRRKQRLRSVEHADEEPVLAVLTAASLLGLTGAPAGQRLRRVLKKSGHRGHGPLGEVIIPM